jgi:hypothetical protein
MKKPGLFIGLGILLIGLGLFLAGCAARPEITPLAPSPMLPFDEDDVPEVTPTDVVEEGGGEATPEPEDASAADDSSCVACHTDEETLRALAVEPEEGGEELSEGEG